MRVLARIVTLPLLAAGLGCSVSGPDGDRDPLARLAEARQRWEASGIVEYDVRMRRVCGECVPTAALAVVVSVSSSGKTVSRADNGVTVAGPLDLYPDVDALFDLIEEQVRAGAEVEADYDGQRGFPRSVSVDPLPGAVDDEFGYVLEDLVAGRHTELRVELAARRAEWAASGFRSYQLTLRRTCFCVPGAAGIVIVNVADREATGRFYFLTGEPVAPEIAPLYPTVDGLFDFLEEAIDRGAESIDVTFDPELGLPQEILVDFRLAAADEEIAFGVEKIVRADDGEDPTAAWNPGR